MYKYINLHMYNTSHYVYLNRDTIMRLLRIFDPNGVRVRRNKRLHRPTYINKVIDDYL